MKAFSPTNPPQQNNAATASSATAEATDSQIRQQRCQRCLNHGEIQIRKNHACPYKNKYHTETCPKCELIDLRRFYNKNINDTAAEEMPVDVETVDAPAAAGTKRGARSPTCAACRLHGENHALRGHKRRCKYSKCNCPKCQLVSHRRAVMAAQVKLRRQQHQQEQISQHHASNAMLSNGHHHANHHLLNGTSSMDDVLFLGMRNSCSSKNSSGSPPKILSASACTSPLSSHQLPLLRPEAFRPKTFASLNGGSDSQLANNRAIGAAKTAAAQMIGLEPLPPFATLPLNSVSAAALMHHRNSLGMLPVALSSSDSVDGSTASSINADSPWQNNNSPPLSSMNLSQSEPPSPFTIDCPNHRLQLFLRMQQQAVLPPLHSCLHQNQIKPLPMPTLCEAQQQLQQHLAAELQSIMQMHAHERFQQDPLGALAMLHLNQQQQHQHQLLMLQQQPHAASLNLLANGLHPLPSAFTLTPPYTPSDVLQHHLSGLPGSLPLQPPTLQSSPKEVAAAANATTSSLANAIMSDQQKAQLLANDFLQSRICLQQAKTSASSPSSSIPGTPTHSATLGETTAASVNSHAQQQQSCQSKMLQEFMLLQQLGAVEAQLGKKTEQT